MRTMTFWAALALAAVALSGCTDATGTDSVAGGPDGMPDDPLRCTRTVEVAHDPSTGVTHNALVSFSYTGTVPGALATVWVVEGEATVAQTVDHTFTAPGAYPVEVRVFTEAGCVAVGAVDLDVENRPPVAHFTYSVDGDTMVLDARGSMDPNGDDLSFEWQINGERVGTGERAVTDVPDEGAILAVVVSDPYGGMDQYREVFRV